eukprot:scaffold94148_cov66-Phaeocystis_antarctica.AAC.1
MLYASYEEVKRSRRRSAVNPNDYFQARERGDHDMSEIVEKLGVDGTPVTRACVRRRDSRNHSLAAGGSAPNTGLERASFAPASLSLNRGKLSCSSDDTACRSG